MQKSYIIKQKAESILYKHIETYIVGFSQKCEGSLTPEKTSYILNLNILRYKKQIEKAPDAGKDWRQEETGATEDDMVGWHH